MRSMKWPAVVGLAVVASLATGCRAKIPKGGPLRSVVQVQRQDKLGQTNVVAYTVVVPGTPLTAVWLTTQPIAELQLPGDGTVSYVPDSDHECNNIAEFHTHMETVHRLWVDAQRPPAQYITTECP